ncbi:hypothetical protein [Paludifilum halophilum]|uniref:Protein kinase domain-containing protein n=1 Tax=Paludifilum halophilum TaxID=1642702 RepID=A0A235BCR5_9BACL|nr:hypothetical protein [Paludifilum halophilum]OYD09859.1 hypothetical protein CHM34_02415 [Paludifilum halophilum]
MIRERERQVRYYERFQVEDVLTFFTGQLIQARSPDGARVLLQEIRLVRPLPAGAQEMLKRMRNSHMLSILDVIVEKDVVVLVHPIFSGEPLPLMVNKDHPMEPVEALRLFRKLVRTLIDLAQFPIPMWTTLDPRNICLYEDEPFVLFCGLKKYTPKPMDDQKQNLLYYLLAGEHPRNVKYRGQDLAKRIKHVPVPIRELAIDLLDRKPSPEEMLRRADEALDKVPSPTVGKRSRRQEKRRLSPLIATLLVILMVGGAVGYLVKSNDWLTTEEDKVADQKPGEKITLDPIQFTEKKPETHSLAEINQSARIRGIIKQEQVRPFSLQLDSKSLSYTYGIQVDSQGRFQFFQKGGESEHTIKQTDPSFHMEKGQTYQVELLYIAGEPLRVSLRDTETGEKWMAVGTVPQDTQLQAEVKGEQGTQFDSGEVTPVTEEGQARRTWMAPQPWRLVFGEGTMNQESLSLNGNALLRSGSGKVSFFTFRRKEGYDGDPIRMELEGAGGSRYSLIWSQDGRLRLHRNSPAGKLLAEKVVHWPFQTGVDAEVSLLTDRNKLAVHVSQDSEKVSLSYTHDEPIDIQKASIKSESGLELIHP